MKLKNIETEDKSVVNHCLKRIQNNYNKQGRIQHLLFDAILNGLQSHLASY